MDSTFTSNLISWIATKRVKIQFETITNIFNLSKTDIQLFRPKPFMIELLRYILFKKLPKCVHIGLTMLRLSHCGWPKPALPYFQVQGAKHKHLITYTLLCISQSLSVQVEQNATEVLSSSTQLSHLIFWTSVVFPSSLSSADGKSSISSTGATVLHINYFTVVIFLISIFYSRSYDNKINIKVIVFAGIFIDQKYGVIILQSTLDNIVQQNNCLQKKYFYCEDNTKPGPVACSLAHGAHRAR